MSLLDDVLQMLSSFGLEGEAAADLLRNELASSPATPFTSPDFGSQRNLDGTTSGSVDGTNTTETFEPGTNNASAGERVESPENAGRGADIDAGPGVTVPPGGDIQSAVDSANDGDVIKLEAGEYNISNSNIYKNVTIDSVEGTVLNGNGAEVGINLSSGASGATIQDVELTNFSDKAIYPAGQKTWCCRT